MTASNENANGMNKPVIESRILFVAMLVLVAVISFGIIVAANQSTAGDTSVRLAAELTRIEAELARANAVIFNLPGGVVQVAAETGIVQDLNVGAIEIFGRSLQLGSTLFGAIADEDIRTRHTSEIFGDNWRKYWTKRRQEGALIVNDAVLQLQDGKTRTVQMRITAVDAAGEEQYIVFIDPRTNGQP